MWNKKSKERFRNEWKYLISTSEKELLEMRMRHILKKDPYAGENGYTIRSLYFEDYFNNAYAEKEAGILMRKKYRIRIYNYSDRSFIHYPWNSFVINDCPWTHKIADTFYIKFSAQRIFASQ